MLAKNCGDIDIALLTELGFQVAINIALLSGAKAA